MSVKDWSRSVCKAALKSQHAGRDTPLPVSFKSPGNHGVSLFFYVEGRLTMRQACSGAIGNETAQQVDSKADRAQDCETTTEEMEQHMWDEWTRALTYFFHRNKRIITIPNLPSLPRTFQPHRRCTPIIIHRMSYMWTFFPLATGVLS